MPGNVFKSRRDVSGKWIKIKLEAAGIFGALGKLCGSSGSLPQYVCGSLHKDILFAEEMRARYRRRFISVSCHSSREVWRIRSLAACLAEPSSERNWREPKSGGRESSLVSLLVL